MPRYKRFGRGIPMPSTAAIKHELKMMEATDTLARALHNEQCSPEEMSQIIADIGDRYEIPPETASTLRRRFAAG
jgi:hypothetical protein